MVEVVGLMPRPISQKNENEMEKIRGHIFFKSKNTNVYVNTRSCKSPCKKRDEAEWTY